MTGILAASAAPLSSCEADEAPTQPPVVKRFVAKLDWKPFGGAGAALPRVSTFDVCGLEVTALPVMHGADYVCFGFAFGLGILFTCGFAFG